MKLVSLGAAIVGIGGIAALILYFGAAAVLHALAAIGWTGFAAICLIHLALIAAMGAAWRVLLPGGRLGIFIWGRLVRDSASEVLPLSQVGGYVLGARALALAGIPGTAAAATSIVDITLEFLGQLVYTALGLVWLVHLRPGSALAWPVTIGLGAAVVGFPFLLMGLRRSGGAFDRLVQLLGRGWRERTAAGAAALRDALAAIYRRRAGMAVSFAVHLFCWIAGGIEIWLALRLARAPLDFGAVLVIESLLYAIRAVAFAVPNAVGVQEGAYILIGATFGLTPELALALSLLKRARDLVIGVPVLGVWQGLEGGRLWRRVTPAARPGRPE